MTKADNERLQQIRERERISHVAMYSNSTLYKEGSWLQKPVKTVMELLPYFDSRNDLRILDLGCGVGRNSIAAARYFQNRSCTIDCVDILELAIRKLNAYADEYKVSNHINGILSSIDSFPIPENHYDCIIAVSALEHVDSEGSFIRKLTEIRNGVCKNGIICLVINSSIKELDKATNREVQPQFEVNLPATELQELLDLTFAGWNILKSTHREQHYDIPRETGTHALQTTVVTFSAMKK